MAETRTVHDPFIGADVQITDALKECPNVRGLSQEEALLEIIDNKPN